MPLHRIRQLRDTALFGWLLLFVVARGLLAPGVMPAFGAQGVSVVLCTAQGPQATWPAKAGIALAHGSLDCPFGLSVGLAALPLAATDLPIAAATVESPLAVEWAHPADEAHRPYLARGPPTNT